ncbi:hypothetical protein P3T22_005930 [Paraburkholderia sp. GAS348]
MRDSLVLQLDANDLPPYVVSLLEHTHSVARGTEAVIRAARVAAVQCELGEPANVASGDVDHLLALAQSAAALLGDRLESIAEHDYTHEHSESRRICSAEQSSRGDA